MQDDTNLGVARLLRTALTMENQASRIQVRLNIFLVYGFWLEVAIWVMFLSLMGQIGRIIFVSYI